MVDLTKTEVARALAILFDIPLSRAKDLERVPVDTLRDIFEGVKKNALAYHELEKRKNSFDES